jgi:hypothetical protein
MDNGNCGREYMDRCGNIGKYMDRHGNGFK